MSIKKLQAGLRRITGVNVILEKFIEGDSNLMCTIPVSLIELFKDTHQFDYHLELIEKVRSAGKLLSIDLTITHKPYDKKEFIDFIQPNIDWINSGLEKVINTKLNKNEGFMIDKVELSLNEYYIYVNLVLSSPDRNIFELIQKNKSEWLTYSKTINNLLSREAPLKSDDVFYNI